MEPKIAEIAERIRALREMLGLSYEEMAEATEVSIDDYIASESGTRDFTFTFLYKCAEKFGVDIIEIMTGENPHLSGYTVVRGGKGLSIKRRAGFEYNHLAAHFKNKLAEPFLVKAPYREEEQNKPIAMSMHEGQEFDYILSGSLKFVHEEHVEELNEGDSVFYDSGRKHGMIATSKDGCTFLAVVIKEKEDENR